LQGIGEEIILNVNMIAGNGEEGVPDDGTVAAKSPLVDPRAAAVDSKGNLYLLERGGNALRVLDKSGKIRTVIAISSQKIFKRHYNKIVSVRRPRNLKRNIVREQELRGPFLKGCERLA